MKLIASISVTGGLLCSHAFGQALLNCSAPFDGGNLVPHPEFEMPLDQSLISSYGNAPLLHFQDCFSTVLDNQLFNKLGGLPNTDFELGYSHARRMHMWNRFEINYHDQIDFYPDGYSIDPSGRFGPLLSSMTPGQQYVVTAMTRPGTFLSTDPSAAYYVHFGNSTFGGIPNILGQMKIYGDDLYSTGNPATWMSFDPGEVQTKVLHFGTEPAAVPGFVTTRPEWSESYCEFVCEDAWNALLVHNGCNPSIPLHDDAGVPLVPEVNSASAYPSTRLGGLYVIPSAANPISISLDDPNSTHPTWKLERQFTCGEEFVLTYEVTPMHSGPFLQDVDLILNQVTVASLDVTDSMNDFGANGVFTIPAGTPHQTITVRAVYNLDGGVFEDSVMAGVYEIFVPTYGVANVNGAYAPHIPTVRVVEEPLTPCQLADFNGNGTVSASDLTDFLAVFGNDVDPATNPCGLGDFDHSGDITASDLMAFLGSFGLTCD